MTERALSAREKLQLISEAVLGGEVGGDGRAQRRDDGKRAFSPNEVARPQRSCHRGGGRGGSQRAFEGSHPLYSSSFSTASAIFWDPQKQSMFE